jgi:hypothetical protein
MTDSLVPKQITGKTKIMFILGDPVAHIRGTALFNEHFLRSGLDAASSPLQVAPADLGTIVGAIRKMRNVAGFGVTLPHKIEVLRHLDATTERAAQVGAVNFVRRSADGQLTGDNVDGIGFAAGLARNGIAPAAPAGRSLSRSPRRGPERSSSPIAAWRRPGSWPRQFRPLFPAAAAPPVPLMWRAPIWW